MNRAATDGESDSTPPVITRAPFIVIPSEVEESGASMPTASPSEEEVAAIVAALEALRQEPAPDITPSRSQWPLRARREALDRWEGTRPHRRWTGDYR
jgi:glycine cleavage system protein P-like pyridoxal-binding family